MTDDEPALKRMGANQREAPSGHNIGVKGTVGPDYLGQESVDVDGHSKNRPGVQFRRPEEDPDDPRIARMDTGEELPVLLSSDMEAGPIEGVQGTYSQIVEGECARCGYDRIVVTVHTLPGEHREKCNACGAIQDHRAEDGYKMPTTQDEKVKREYASGERIGSLLTRDVLDKEETTGIGPYISLVDGNGYTRLRKDDVEDLFWLLVDNDDINIVESCRDHQHPGDQALTGFSLLPEETQQKLSDDED